jgi:hypothetical protein
VSLNPFDFYQACDRAASGERKATEIYRLNGDRTLTSKTAIAPSIVKKFKSQLLDADNQKQL